MDPKTFIFKDLLEGTNTRCKVTITVLCQNSNNSSVFNINFDYQYLDSNNKEIDIDKFSIVNPHPFFKCDKSIEDTSNGEIVIKNSMTTEMVNYMLMDDDELSKHSGLAHPQYYRNIIMSEW